MSRQETRLDIAAESARSPDALRLVGLLSAELRARSDNEDNGVAGFSPADVETPGGAFLVTRQNGVGVGCVALRPLDDGTAEIKRMFVEEAARGRGIGEALLTAVEKAAFANGFHQLFLETGIRNPEAIRLYGRHGFQSVPRYGPYINDPRSICFAKDLP